jgi:hypothetical protein
MTAPGYRHLLLGPAPTSARVPVGPAPPSVATRGVLPPAVPADAAPPRALPPAAAAPARPAAVAPPAAPARATAAAPRAAPARISDEDSEKVMFATLTSSLSGMDNDELCELALDKGMGLGDIANFQQLGEREGMGAAWGLVVMHETHRLRQMGRLSLPPLPERPHAEVALEAARARATMELMNMLFPGL